MELTICAELVIWILQRLAKTVVEVAPHHGHSHLADHFQEDYGCYRFPRLQFLIVLSPGGGAWGSVVVKELRY
jgi:hypothetical protein